MTFSVEDESVDEFTHPDEKYLSKILSHCLTENKAQNLERKLFQTHLLTITKNQMIIQKSEIISQKKGEKKMEKSRKLKEFWQGEKQKREGGPTEKKKKVTCRQDKIRVPSLPRKVTKRMAPKLSTLDLKV